MPIPVFPDLPDGIGNLRSRAWGTSCFRGRAHNGVQVAALAEQTRPGHERYRDAGTVRDID